MYLTDIEHQKLTEKFGDVRLKGMIERLNNYIGSKGIKYKSHYHTILNWAGKDEACNTLEKEKRNVAAPAYNGLSAEEVRKETEEWMRWKEGGNDEG